ncbi:putative MFS family arabinose efflux permease [Tamaricihabitans halophyticus]|uniref:Putative MFS family arabinose efflux permease n=1 Tax=Tamaricihabitans halophyticus TaxID=1262583 RepID=A0A4R2QHV9_9PSEU|nr:MFS transporter [Tamaricihabitans halophyticus]TCP47968.1 putative MFS family arabinose efflux permease [Tamaricihabitans halophyticus]
MSRSANTALYSRNFLLLICAVVCMSIGYATLLPVLPLWAVRGGASEFVGGTMSGLFMATTVLAQLGTPWLSRKLGYRLTLALGCLLLGAPAPLFGFITDAEPMLVLSAIRGIGFGLTTVTGSALVAELLPRHELGRGSGLQGVAVTLPQLVGLPAGVWLAENWSYPGVFWLTGIVPVLGCVPALLLPRLSGQLTPPGGGRPIAQLRALLGPWLAAFAVGLGYGAVVTFVPMSISTSVLVLLAVGSAMLLGRWASGVVADRMLAPGQQLPAGVLLGAAGLAGIALAIAASSGWLAVLAGALFGLGYGVIQNDALVVMFHRVPPYRYGLASANWNVAIDGGYGLGAVLIGAIVTGPGFVAAFGVSAGLLLAVLLPAVVVARRVRRTAAPERDDSRDVALDRA